MEPPNPPRPLPPYTPFRTLAASTAHHAHPTVYDSAIGYGAPRVYWGASHADDLAKDPFYRATNYVRDAVWDYRNLYAGFVAFWQTVNWMMAPRSEEGLVGVGEGEARLVVDDEMMEKRGQVWLHRAVKGLKDKIQVGMPPMSIQRWERRKLSSLEHEYEATELLRKTLAVFTYLNDPTVQQFLRLAHNRMTKHLLPFDQIINDHRRRHEQPEVPLMELWDAYTKALFADVATRAHGWIVGRIAAMRGTQAAAFDRMKAQDRLPDAQNTKILARLSMLVDLERDVDYNFRISRYGFTRAAAAASSSAASSSSPPSPEKFAEEREKMRAAAEAAVGIFAGGITQMRHAMGVGPFPFQFEYFMVLNDQADANKAVRGKDPKKRSKLFGPPPQKQKPEPWVQELIERLEDPKDKTNSFGFVVYREKEYEGVAWEKLEEVITEDLMNWGDKMPGADKIKPKAKLHWIEMAHTGIENYRSHFDTLRTNNLLAPGTCPSTFLVIDPRAANAWFPQHSGAASTAHAFAERHPFRGHTGTSTMSSTTSTALDAMLTDFEPWVLAVDANFPVSVGAPYVDAALNASLYRGWARVQSSLVFEELYGLAAAATGGGLERPGTRLGAAGVLRLGQMWRVAASHPCAVYTGAAVTEVEIRRFAEWSGLRSRAVRWVLDRPDVLFYGRR
ncbi:hypothetical protein BFW01_g2019 [Lasiodiplodia theobromae]|nr:hypothetical protein BFW01_g2019 [Lasiodiplodia theobromae]